MVNVGRWWTKEDAAIMARVFGRKQSPILNGNFSPVCRSEMNWTWDWTPTMADWRDARIMRMLTQCPARGLLAKRVALRLQGEQIAS